MSNLEVEKNSCLVIDDDLIANTGRSTRYHDKRAAFFDRLDKFLTFVSLMFSSATITVLLGNHTVVAAVMAVIASAASALSLVGGFAMKSRDHFELKKQWYDLMTQAQGCCDNSDIEKVKKDCATLERGEPAIMLWLNEICYQEQHRAYGFTQKKIDAVSPPIPWYFRMLANVTNFGYADYQEKCARKCEKE